MLKIFILAQRVFLTVFLSIVYVIGLGATLFLLMIFNRRLLARLSDNPKTFWEEAEGYEPDIIECRRQS